MITVIAFLGAISLSVIVFELTSALTGGLVGRDRLMGVQTDTQMEERMRRPSSWHALLVVFWPQRFDPQVAKNKADVVSMLRRAGYPYDTPGEFYAAAVRMFAMFLLVGGLKAGMLFLLGMPLQGLVVAGMYIFLGLRRPYTRLKKLAEIRARAMRNNMLTGLALLSALLSAGVGVQEALRRTAGVGGPFCNLLALLIARIETEDISRAIKTTIAHLPDPGDVEGNLFLRDISDYFVNNRPLLSSVQALQESVHRNVVEDTEERAALVKQRSGLFGVLAVIGLVISIIAPFAGVIF